MIHSDNRIAPLSSAGRRSAWGGALLLVLGSLGSVRADGVVRDSIGPISSGRGGTNLAYSDNLALINDNPAGLSRLGGVRLELGVDLLKTDISYSDPQNDAEAKDEWFALPNAALSWQIKAAPFPVVVGLGVFVPAGYGAEYELNHVVYGKQKYTSEAGLYKIMPSVSVELPIGLSVGAGVGLAYEKLGVDTPYTFQTGAFMGVPALVDLDADGFGLAWNVGTQYHISDRWTIGVAYIAETQIDLKGDFDVSLAGSPLGSLFADPDANYDVEAESSFPRSVGAGTAYRFDRGTVSVDFLWYDWSSAFDVFTFKLKNGDNPAFDALAGPTPVDKFPLKWHDSYTVRLGGEFFLTPQDTLRAGYIYVTNPVPERTLTPLIPAVLEHAVSAGYGRRFGQVGFDLAYQFSWSSRHHVDSSDVVGGDFDQSSLRAMAHWLFLGANINF